MATRSIFAETTSEGWRGRYCHWDGHPGTKIDQLLFLVARDGLEKVKQVLLHDNYSWSSIDPFSEPDSSETRFKNVAGYGIAHNDLTETEQYWFQQSDADFAWTEYLYVFGNDGIQVWSATGENEWETSLSNFHPYTSKLETSK